MTAASVKVPLSDVRPDEEIRAAAADAVAGGWWSMGPRVAQFEGDFASLTGSPHVFAVANGTAALHLALLAANIGSGDEVIVPSLNFVAAANVVSLVGATPVFCDIVSPTDLNLDPADVEAAITPRTRAVIALHYAGFPCEMDALLPLASAVGATVIEDAAHAPGATTRGRACGTLGAIGCFSFFANKNLPIGEGGMVVTGSDEFADALRLLRSHGMTTLTWDRHRGHADTYDVLRSGLNYRLDEIRAAIGIVQLARLEDENRRRGEIWRTYIEQLADFDGVVFPFVDRELDEKPSHHLAVAVLDHALDRRAFRAFLLDRGVQTSVHYPPIHRFTAYRDAPQMRALPHTDDVAPRIVTLPLYGGMSDEQIATVVDAVRDAILDQSPSPTASHGVVETPSRQA